MQMPGLLAPLTMSELLGLALYLEADLGGGLEGEPEAQTAEAAVVVVAVIAT